MFHFMVVERASTSEAEAGKIKDLHVAICSENIGYFSQECKF
jgi:hypothetical protein